MLYMWNFIVKIDPMQAMNTLQHRLEVNFHICTSVALSQMKDVLESL